MKKNTQAKTKQENNSDLINFSKNFLGTSNSTKMNMRNTKWITLLKNQIS